MSDVEEKFRLIVVLNKGAEARRNAARCVYVNDHRIVGGKPYYSEGLPQWEREFTLSDLRNAFPQFTIELKAAAKP